MDPFPVLATIHGGAWMFGDKGDDFNLPFLEGLKRGYAVACINYRLSDEAQFPSQIYDCKAAIRYLRAQRRRIQTGRRAHWGLGRLSGRASGGPARYQQQESKGWRTSPSRIRTTVFPLKVQAVVVWYGPNENFLTMDDELAKSGLGIPNHSEADSPESRLLGRKITEIPALVKFASPMTYIRPMRRLFSSNMV